MTSLGRSSRDVWARLPRPVRFVLVGGVNTVFGYGAYALLLVVGFHYAMAALLGTIAGVVFNFVMTGALVFGDRSPSRLGRFVGVYSVTYALNVACLAALTRGGLDAYVAGIVCLAPMAAVSYLLMRTFVFAPRPWR